MKNMRLFMFMPMVAVFVACNQPASQTTSVSQVKTDTMPVAGSLVIDFKPGQRWHYKTRPGEDSSTLIILKTGYYNHVGLVHVCVEGVDVKNPYKPGLDTLFHMPFSKEAMQKSVTQLISENNPLPDYIEGYNNWKKEFDAGTGGFFSTQVSEALDASQQAISRQVVSTQ